MEKILQKLTLFQELVKIYYDPDEEGSYGGIEKLLRAAKAKRLKVSEKSIKDYLDIKSVIVYISRQDKISKDIKQLLEELISNGKLIWMIWSPLEED